jgi:hypothetical protein
VQRSGWPVGQIASTRQPSAAKRIAIRAVNDHHDVLATSTVRGPGDAPAQAECASLKAASETGAEEILATQCNSTCFVINFDRERQAVRPDAAYRETTV